MSVMPKEQPHWTPTAEFCELFECALNVERQVRDQGNHKGAVYFRWTVYHKNGMTLSGEEQDIQEARQKAEKAARALHSLYGN